MRKGEIVEKATSHYGKKEEKPEEKPNYFRPEAKENENVNIAA